MLCWLFHYNLKRILQIIDKKQSRVCDYKTVDGYRRLQIRAWTTTSQADIRLNDELTLWFAPVHLAEIQTLLECMEEETEEVCIGPLDI